jgi:predicted MFS family arabinose efflux permease
MATSSNLPLLSRPACQYAIVTGNYWAFTLTDGALRMLVVLHFHQLGYSPMEVALLFLFYEMFGVVTNLAGGWLGARLGLNLTMNVGLAMQVTALLLLAAPPAWLTVSWVMAAQALSGIAKDLNKMSAKSAIKQLVPSDQQGKLYRWVAVLTGSKNALKGVGFFLGGALLSTVGFSNAVVWMAGALALVWLCSILLLKQDLGRAKNKPKFRDIFSKSATVNSLSAARFFLFGARDIWFVVALPVYLSSVMGWNFWMVGGFLAAWVIGYGVVQSLTPNITGGRGGRTPGANAVFRWAALLAAIPAAIALGLQQALAVGPILIGGLMLFGAIFAVNSSIHSYLIVSVANEDGVSLDVGFYYMANAMGRLVGTVLSGGIFQAYGLAACLWVSAAMVAAAALISLRLRPSFPETRKIARHP